MPVGTLLRTLPLVTCDLPLTKSPGRLPLGAFQPNNATPFDTTIYCIIIIDDPLVKFLTWGQLC